jgi:hypothetical protein
VLRKDGVETPLGTAVWNGTDKLAISTRMPGKGGLFAGRIVGAFARPSTALAHIYAISIEPDADLSPVYPGGRLQATRIETISTRTVAENGFRAGACLHKRFAQPSGAAAKIYKCIRIIDGSAAPKPRKSLSFASVTRMGGPAKVASLKVSIPGKTNPTGIYAGVRFVGFFAIPSRARERIEPTFDAIVAAKRLTDTIYVDTNVHRPLTMGTPLILGTTLRLGAWTRS